MAAGGFLATLNSLAPYIAAGGQIAGGIGAGRAAGRQAENASIMDRDQAELLRYQQEQLAKLGAARLTEDATQDRATRFQESSQKRARQAGIGSLLQNIQGVKIGGLPSYIPNIEVTGGLHPDQLGALARGSGGQLARDAVAAQLSGADIPDLPDTSAIGGDAPEQTPLAESGVLDKILAGAGYAGTGLKAYNEIKNQQRSDDEPLPDVRYGENVAQNIPRPFTPEGPAAGTIAPVAGLPPKMTTMDLMRLLAQRGGGAA